MNAPPLIRLELFNSPPTVRGGSNGDGDGAASSTSRSEGVGEAPSPSPKRDEGRRRRDEGIRRRREEGDRVGGTASPNSPRRSLSMGRRLLNTLTFGLSAAAEGGSMAGSEEPAGGMGGGERASAVHVAGTAVDDAHLSLCLSPETAHDPSCSPARRHGNPSDDSSYAFSPSAPLEELPILPNGRGDVADISTVVDGGRDGAAMSAYDALEAALLAGAHQQQMDMTDGGRRKGGERSASSAAGRSSNGTDTAQSAAPENSHSPTRSPSATSPSITEASAPPLSAQSSSAFGGASFGFAHRPIAALLGGGGGGGGSGVGVRSYPHHHAHLPSSASHTPIIVADVGSSSVADARVPTHHSAHGDEHDHHGHADAVSAGPSHGLLLNPAIDACGSGHFEGGYARGFDIGDADANGDEDGSDSAVALAVVNSGGETFEEFAEAFARSQRSNSAREGGGSQPSGGFGGASSSPPRSPASAPSSGHLGASSLSPSAAYLNRLQIIQSMLAAAGGRDGSSADRHPSAERGGEESSSGRRQSLSPPALPSPNGHTFRGGDRRVSFGAAMRLSDPMNDDADAAERRAFWERHRSPPLVAATDNTSSAHVPRATSASSVDPLPTATVSGVFAAGANTLGRAMANPLDAVGIGGYAPMRAHLLGEPFAHAKQQHQNQQGGGGAVFVVGGALHSNAGATEHSLALRVVASPSRTPARADRGGRGEGVVEEAEAGPSYEGGAQLSAADRLVRAMMWGPLDPPPSTDDDSSSTSSSSSSSSGSASSYTMARRGGALVSDDVAASGNRGGSAPPAAAAHYCGIDTYVLRHAPEGAANAKAGRAGPHKKRGIRGASRAVGGANATAGHDRRHHPPPPPALFVVAPSSAAVALAERNLMLRGESHRQPTNHPVVPSSSSVGGVIESSSSTSFLKSVLGGAEVRNAMASQAAQHSAALALVAKERREEKQRTVHHLKALLARLAGMEADHSAALAALKEQLESESAARAAAEGAAAAANKSAAAHSDAAVLLSETVGALEEDLEAERRGRAAAIAAAVAETEAAVEAQWAAREEEMRQLQAAADLTPPPSDAAEGATSTTSASEAEGAAALRALPSLFMRTNTIVGSQLPLVADGQKQLPPRVGKGSAEDLLAASLPPPSPSLGASAALTAAASTLSRQAQAFFSAASAVGPSHSSQPLQHQQTSHQSANSDKERDEEVRRLKEALVATKGAAILSSAMAVVTNAKGATANASSFHADNTFTNSSFTNASWASDGDPLRVAKSSGRPSPKLAASDDGASPHHNRRDRSPHHHSAHDAAGGHPSKYMPTPQQTQKHQQWRASGSSPSDGGSSPLQQSPPLNHSGEEGYLYSQSSTANGARRPSSARRLSPAAAAVLNKESERWSPSAVGASLSLGPLSTLPSRRGGSLLAAASSSGLLTHSAAAVPPSAALLSGGASSNAVPLKEEAHWQAKIESLEDEVFRLKTARGKAEWEHAAEVERLQAALAAALRSPQPTASVTASVSPSRATTTAANASVAAGAIGPALAGTAKSSPITSPVTQSISPPMASSSSSALALASTSAVGAAVPPISGGGETNASASDAANFVRTASNAAAMLPERAKAFMMNAVASGQVMPTKSTFAPQQQQQQQQQNGQGQQGKGGAANRASSVPPMREREEKDRARGSSAAGSSISSSKTASRSPSTAPLSMGGGLLSPGRDEEDDRRKAGKRSTALGTSDGNTDATDAAADDDDRAKAAMSRVASSLGPLAPALSMARRPTIAPGAPLSAPASPRHGGETASPNSNKGPLGSSPPTSSLKYGSASGRPLSPAERRQQRREEGHAVWLEAQLSGAKKALTAAEAEATALRDGIAARVAEATAAERARIAPLVQTLRQKIESMAADAAALRRQNSELVVAVAEAEGAAAAMRREHEEKERSLEETIRSLRAAALAAASRRPSATEKKDEEGGNARRSLDGFASDSEKSEAPAAEQKPQSQRARSFSLRRGDGGSLGDMLHVAASSPSTPTTTAATSASRPALPAPSAPALATAPSVATEQSVASLRTAPPLPHRAKPTSPPPPPRPTYAKDEAAGGTAAASRSASATTSDYGNDALYSRLRPSASGGGRLLPTGDAAPREGGGGLGSHPLLAAEALDAAALLRRRLSSSQPYGAPAAANVGGVPSKGLGAEAERFLALARRASGNGDAGGVGIGAHHGPPVGPPSFPHRSTSQF